MIHGQTYAEGGAFAHFALYLDGSFVSLHQGLDERQPEPNPLCLGGEKRLEEFLHVLLWNPAALVLEVYNDELVLCPSSDF